ncbi:hypothetical protein RJT34_16344 [Clitoria ternatea]|uniref:Uncharacterized protein n=1 Tax=Clitoria ternatea TaxID=43366 RepID=A0AAN9PC83_CLITE
MIVTSCSVTFSCYLCPCLSSDVTLEDICRSQFSSWCCIGDSIHSKQKTKMGLMTKTLLCYLCIPSSVLVHLIYMFGFGDNWFMFGISYAHKFVTSLHDGENYI